MNIESVQHKITRLAAVRGHGYEKREGHNKPYNDVCALGGKSFIWAVKYNTGGASGASLKGVAILQVSTGSIEQINLSTALTEKGGRRTSAMEGVPPTAQGLSLLSQPPPVKRTIHVNER